MYVIRQISPPGKSAVANKNSTVELTLAMIQGSTKFGKYLEWSDPNAKNGMGDDGWTDDIEKAKKFATQTEAAECWQAVSLVRPMRSDGKPNRPLTAYNVCIEPAP